MQHHSRQEINFISEGTNFYHWRSEKVLSDFKEHTLIFKDFYQSPNLTQVHRNQSVLVVLQEVDQYVEAVVEDEEVASVLGEELEEVILILQGQALEGEDHSSSSLALRQKAFCAWKNTQYESNTFDLADKESFLNQVLLLREVIDVKS